MSPRSILSWGTSTRSAAVAEVGSGDAIQPIKRKPDVDGQLLAAAVCAAKRKPDGIGDAWCFYHHHRLRTGLMHDDRHGGVNGRIGIVFHLYCNRWGRR